MPRRVAFRVLDALEDGEVGFAAALLQAALEDAPVRPPRCDVCGVYAWPGDRRAHIFSLHREAA